MNSAIAWFARNSVAANLLMLLIFGAGIVTLLFGVKQEVFPEFSLDRITITVPYPGAAPAEVEDGVTIKVEEAIQGLDGIERITSTSSEGVSVTVAELYLGEDAREVLDDIKARIDAITTFPDEAEEPTIQELTNRRQVINVAVHASTDERTIKELAQRVRDEIAAIEGISVAELVSVRPYEVSIEVSEQALRRHGLTFDAVARAVRASSLDLPGGSVRTREGEILLRTESQAYEQSEFASIPLIARPDGSRVLVGDVARVVDGFAETDQTSRFDGESSAMVQVFRIGEQDALDISQKVRDYVENAGAWLPEGVNMSVWQDQAQVLKARRDLLTKNARWGFFLVFSVLALFMRFRLAKWMTIGIVISFFGALWLMPVFGVSINLISLFAFILVLGIIVDDAIIVGENIFSHQHRTGKGLQSAIEGAQEVAVPVVFAVLTTVAAFAPLLNVPGTTGKIMRVVPIVVILALMFSLIESLFVLPAHLSHYRKRSLGEGNALSRGWRRFQGYFADGLVWIVRRVYTPVLERAIEWRYLTASVGLATLLLTAALAGGGYVKFVFFPNVEADFVTGRVSMPQGTPVEVTTRVVEQLERAALDVERELAEDGNGALYRHVLFTVGDQPMSTQRERNAGNVSTGVSAAHLGELAIELVPSEAREVTSSELVRRWRQKVGTIPEAQALAFSGSIFSPGAPINVQLTGDDIERLIAAAEELKEKLGEYAGVFDVADSFEPGKREIELDIKASAELLGLSQRDLARQVRQAFYGEEVQRIQREKDEVKVFVRYPAETRRTLGSLESMRVRTGDGQEVPFSAVADTSIGRGFASIQRVDRRRAINVTADVDSTEGNANEIIADLGQSFLPDLSARYPGLMFSFEGQGREQRQTLLGLLQGFAIAMMLIYALMAIPFRSYVQPLIVMTAIPFGLVGAVWGHMIMGLDLTILSMFGLVALAGVVVNDSLVLVDFVNRNRRSGVALGQAVRNAGAARFRPVILTSITTFVGLTPLLLERSMQAKFLIPMAVSLGFGVVFSTVISLVLVPCGYVMLDDVKRRAIGAWHWLTNRSREEAEGGAWVAPAPAGAEAGARRQAEGGESPSVSATV